MKKFTRKELLREILTSIYGVANVREDGNYCEPVVVFSNGLFDMCKFTKGYGNRYITLFSYTFLRNDTSFYKKEYEPKNKFDFNQSKAIEGIFRFFKNMRLFPLNENLDLSKLQPEEISEIGEKIFEILYIFFIPVIFFMEGKVDKDALEKEVVFACLDFPKIERKITNIFRYANGLPLLPDDPNERPYLFPINGSSEFGIPIEILIFDPEIEDLDHQCASFFYEYQAWSKSEQYGFTLPNLKSNGKLSYRYYKKGFEKLIDERIDLRDQSYKNHEDKGKLKTGFFWEYREDYKRMVSYKLCKEDICRIHRYIDAEYEKVCFDDLRAYYSNLMTSIISDLRCSRRIDRSRLAEFFHLLREELIPYLIRFVEFEEIIKYCGKFKKLMNDEHDSKIKQAMEQYVDTLLDKCKEQLLETTYKGATKDEIAWLDEQFVYLQKKSDPEIELEDRRLDRIGYILSVGGLVSKTVK